MAAPFVDTANQILQVVRGMENSKGSVMTALYRIAEGKVEAMEFVVNETTRHLKTPLKDLHLKKGILIAVIVHQGRVIIPQGSTCMEQGDTVIIVSGDEGILDVNDIFDDSLLDAGVIGGTGL